MITLRPSNKRGKTAADWLDSYHTFSFNYYYDPQQVGFRALRVINEDFVKPGAGFPTHSHREMEILTYILAGELEHRDSTGGGSVLGRGEIQRMSAGTGISHSEFNHSRTEPVHLLQIWIIPGEHGIKPSYEQQRFDLAEARNQLKLLAAPAGDGGVVSIHQDARLYVSLLNTGEQISYKSAPDRHIWIQVARGEININGQHLSEGDGAAIVAEDLQIKAANDAEFLLFDLA